MCVGARKAMKEAVRSVWAVHKEAKRKLKEQLRNERAQWQLEHEHLNKTIEDLERSKQDLRAIVRQQTQALTSYKDLLRAHGLLPSVADKDDAGADTRAPEVCAVEERAPAPGRRVAPMAAIVDALANRAPENALAPAAKRPRSDDAHVVVDSQGEWDVVQIGSVGGGGGGAGGTARAVVQAVRGKKARANLPSVTDCAMCAPFVELMAAETGCERQALLQLCARHRSSHPEPDTPPGYWDVGFK